MINLNDINTINWKNQKVSILGAGITGVGAAKLAQHLKINVLLSDIKNTTIDINKTDNFNYELSGHSDEVLKSDLVIKSPGIPNEIDILQRCIKKKIPIVSEIEFASWFSHCNIIAITGSNGKTTTVNLAYNIFKNAGIDVLLGGNIGKAYSDNVLDELKNNRKVLHVLEISSYQAEHLVHFNPIISCILNISEDHMDRYNDINEYIDAKLNISKNLSAKTKLVYNTDDYYLNKRLTANKSNIPFSMVKNNNLKIQYKDGRICFSNGNYLSLSRISLFGLHNIYNILAASTIAQLYGIESLEIIDALEKFRSLPHRIELVTKLNGVTCINDSKSTNIASAIAAINCFENINLIIGGESKGPINVNKLIEKIIRHINVKNIIIYGDVILELKIALTHETNIYYCNKFKDAVNTSIKISTINDCILLSPAFSSFDQFKNYKERGNAFIDIIRDSENAE